MYSIYRVTLLLLALISQSYQQLLSKSYLGVVWLSLSGN